MHTGAKSVEDKYWKQGREIIADKGELNEQSYWCASLLLRHYSVNQLLLLLLEISSYFQRLVNIIVVFPSVYRFLSI